LEEYIDIVDQQGHPIGTSATKSEIHSKGHLHNTAHLWLYTAKGDLLLQQRAASKLIYPLLWDVSVAGHINAGETIENGLIRETKEELGIDIKKEQLLKIGVFESFQSYPNGITDNEFHNTYIAKTQMSISNIQIQVDEVEAVKYVTIDEFLSLLKHSETNGHFVSSNQNYYKQVIHAIVSNLTT
jgi:isopentenyl-diphosphate delta-isomerase type 1